MTNSNSTHTLTETTVATIHTTLQYNPETENIEHNKTTIGDSLDSYDTDIQCSCGTEFDTHENAEQHLKDTATNS